MTTDSPARPRGRPRDPSVDDNIVNAAVDLLTEGGFERLSMEAVAARAGVAKATIYRRFACKVDLIVAMCQAFSPPISEAPNTGALRTDLEMWVSSLVDSLTSSDTGRLLPAMISAAKENVEVREALHRFSATRRSRIIGIVAEAIDRGDLPPTADADLIGDVVVGALMYRTMIRGGVIDAPFIASLIDGVLGGFARGTEGRFSAPSRKSKKPAP